MVSVSGVFGSMWELLKAVVPQNVDPVLFFATFIISAALIFVVIQTIKFFQESRGTALIISLILAYFTASSAFVTVIVSKFFPNVGLVMMAILGIMLVIVFVSPDSAKEGFSGSPIIIIIAFVVIVALTWSFAAPELQAAGVIGSGTGSSITNEDTALIIFVIMMMGFMYFLFKGPKKEKGRLDQLLDWSKGKKW